MRRTLLLFMLSLLVCVGWGQTYRYRYWIDDNAGNAVSGSGTGEIQFNVSLTPLTTGLHAIHVQAQSTDGVWSSVHTRYFLKQEKKVASVTARYWLDDDMSTLHNNVATSGIIELDIPQLGVGVHAVHYQTIGTDGTPSTTRTRFFLKQEDNVVGVSARYWFDNDTLAMHNNVATSGIIDIDISRLGMGVHAVHYQTIGTDGTLSTTRTRYFYVDHAQKGSFKASISIDNCEATVYAPNDDDIVIDITGLADGEHSLHVTLFDANGYAMGEREQTFNKTSIIVQKGDVNGDGSIDIGDIVMVISVMTGTETDAEIKARADVNGDGVADIGDIVNIIDIMSAKP